METIQEIKDKYAIEQGYPNWNELRHWRDVSGVADAYMDEICIRAQKAALEKAAENAKIEKEYSIKYQDFIPDGIDKDSITNPENLIR